MIAGTILPFLIVEIALRAVGFSFHLMPERIEFGYPNPVVLRQAFVEDDNLLWVLPDYAENVRELVQRGADVLFIGDSCPRNGSYDTYLKMLIDSQHHGNTLTFGNLAVNGWSSYQGRIQTRRDVARIRTKIVFVHFGWNDHWIGFGIEDKTAGKIKELANAVPRPMRDLRVVQLVVRFLIGRESAHAGLPNRVSPQDFRENLMDIANSVLRQGALPVLVTAPTSHTPGREPEYLAKRWLRSLDELIPLHQQYAQITRDVAREAQVPLCDLEKIFAEKALRSNLDRYFTDDGIHTSEYGSVAVAALLYECLRESGPYLPDLGITLP